MNNNKALKSGIWYTISNFMNKSMIFFTTPIFTRMLTHIEFGIFNNYLSWLSILTIFITLNLESTIISARYDYEDNFDNYIFSMLSLSSVNTLIWFIVISLKKSFVESFFGLSITYVYAMLLYLLFLPAVNMFQLKERYFFKYKKSVLVSVILSWGTTLLSVVLVILMPNKLDGRIIGAVVPTVLIGFIFYIYFFKKGKRINIKYWKYAIPICLPYIPHLLSMTLLNSTDRVMITKMCGNEQTSLYSLAYTCGTMVTLLLTSLNGAFAPWLGEKLNKKEYSEIHKFSYIYISTFLAMAIGIMLISPEALLILGGKSYMEAIYVLAPVSIGCVCQFLYTMFVNVEQFKKQTKGMAIGSIIAATVNILLNYIFIPIFGYLAAAYTTLVGYLVLLIIHMYLVKRLNLNKIYDYRFIAFVVVFGILLMILILYLYSHIILRYFFICIYIISMVYGFIRYKDRILINIKRK